MLPLSVVFEKHLKESYKTNFFSIYRFFRFRFSFFLVKETRNPKKHLMYIQYIL